MTTETTNGCSLLQPSSQSHPSPASFQQDASSTFNYNNNDSNSIHSSTPSPQLSYTHPQTFDIACNDNQIQHPALDSNHNNSFTNSASSYSNATVDDTMTDREHSSRSSLLLRQYILNPYQSIKLYLSSPAHVREHYSKSVNSSSLPSLSPFSASASVSTPASGTTTVVHIHPWVARYVPPWLLPQYRTKRLMVRSTILRPICRLLVLIAILAFLIAYTILYSFRSGLPELSDYGALTDFDWEPINPRSYLSPMTNMSFGVGVDGELEYDVMLDGHSHSIYSDGRMDPETLLKWHIANGYNAVVVSDHNTIAGGLAAQEIALEKYKDRITVIPAMELTCCRLHMNLIGINETIDIAIRKWPTDEQIKATIDRTHALGGLAIINHIPWSNTTEYGYHLPRMQNHPSREKLVEMGIDGFEIVNGGTLDTISLKFIQDNNLLLITGTDVHYPDTGAYSWTILNTNNNRSMANIMTQLRARKTSFLFDPTGTQQVAYPPENEQYYKSAPPRLLGQYFQMFWKEQSGMYSFSPEGGFCHEEQLSIRWHLIAYFFAWVLLGFLIFEAVRLLLVGCCWGPWQRRCQYQRRKKMVRDESRREDGIDNDNDDDDDYV